MKFPAYLVFVEKNVNNSLLVEVYSNSGDKYSSLEAVNHTFAQSMAATGSLGSLEEGKLEEKNLVCLFLP